MPRYKTIGMARNGGLQKDINDYMSGVGGAPYLTERMRGPYLVTLDGANRLMRGGALLDTTGTGTGYFIFVMDADGRIFSEDKVVIQHHSAFLAGNPVAAAGFIAVTNGQLTDINNSSGHYMPPHDYTEQAIKELKRRGHNVTGVTRHYAGQTSKARTKTAKRVGYSVSRMGPKGPQASFF